MADHNICCFGGMNDYEDPRTGGYISKEEYERRYGNKRSDEDEEDR